jgi:HEPN domain-containing protein
MLRRNDLVDAWFLQARIDLQAAKFLLSAEGEVLSGVACYHAQQSAEKALKAFLCAADREVEKTHDLVRLLDLCDDVSPLLRALAPEAILLTPLATQFRYPGIGPNPDKALARQAIVAAERILSAADKALA